MAGCPRVGARTHGAAAAVLALSLGALVAAAGVGCASHVAATTTASETQRDVAQRFSVAVLRGEARIARGLLVRPHEPALVYLVRRGASRAKGGRSTIRLPVQRRGEKWVVGYSVKRTYADGRFEVERGELVTRLADSTDGPRVRFFLFAHVRTRVSTHHDAQLLPSKR